MDQLFEMVEDLQAQVNVMSLGSSRKRTRSSASNEPDSKQHKRSDNPDFSLLTKELFKNGLLVKAQKHWAEVPAFLESKTCDLVNSIRVPNSDIPLQGRLITIAKNFARAITAEVSDFLETELQASRRRIDMLDDTDFDMAHEISNRYLAKRAGTNRQQNNSGKSVRFSYSDDGHSPRQNKGYSTDVNPNPHPKPGMGKKVNLLSDKLTSVSLDSDSNTDSTPKGKRKAISISPEDSIAAQPAAKNDKLTEFVSDVECTQANPDRKPLDKRSRPSSTYLKKSPGVHVFTGAKDDWIIQPTAADNVVILADSNCRLAEVPPKYDCFVLPGAQLRHATEALRKWGRDKEPGQHTVVIQVGINNRANHPDALDVDITKLSKVIENNPKIKRTVFMGVSFPDSLPRTEKQNLLHLNQRMFDRWGEENYVEPVEPHSVEIEEGDLYGIHHNGSTRQRIVDSLVARLGQLV